MSKSKKQSRARSVPPPDLPPAAARPPHQEIDQPVISQPKPSEREVVPVLTPITAALLLQTVREIWSRLPSPEPDTEETLKHATALVVAFWQYAYPQSLTQIWCWNIGAVPSLKGDGFDFFYRDSVSARLEAKIAHRHEAAADQRPGGKGPTVQVMGESGSMALVLFFKPHEATRFRAFGTLQAGVAEFIRRHPFLASADQDVIRAHVPALARPAFDTAFLRLLRGA
jgi:hypothetical protein